MGIMLDFRRHFVLWITLKDRSLKPHYLGVASDADHSDTTSVIFFHGDSTVLFCGPCRLHVLLNRSCNSGSQVQNRTMLTLTHFEHIQDSLFHFNPLYYGALSPGLRED